MGKIRLIVFYIFLLTVGSFAVFGISAHAQSCGEGYQMVAGICSPVVNGSGLAGTSDYKQLLVKVIDFLLELSGAVSVLFVLYGGFMYMTAGSNDDQVKKGKMAIQYALIGVVIITLSYAIVHVVVNFVAGS